MSIMILAADIPGGTQGWRLGRGWKADRERAGGGERKGSPGGGDSTGKGLVEHGTSKNGDKVPGTWRRGCGTSETGNGGAAGGQGVLCPAQRVTF